MTLFPAPHRLVLAAALACGLAAPALAQNITTVNGKPVPKARADQLYEQVKKQAETQGQQIPPGTEQQVKDEIVLREIFVQEAERRGLPASAEYRVQMELARQSILIRELFTDFQKKNQISDADIQAEYDKFKAQATAEKEYKVRHILVEKEEDAKSITAQLKAGGNFEEIAKSKSKDPGSAAKGGDLDWAGPGSYVPEFSQAMTKLQKGQTTDAPVKSQFGWHILKLEDVRDAQFPPLAEVKPQIQQRLQQQKLAAFRDELQKKAKTDYKFGSASN
ncbi:MAG TPA: peptidylprolyl isomerase [Methylibium sp.]|uniref:peptidylprolyl isomerase n=1 Tax=Methylibium sp. TaxID=2067992 RepID=UPI002DBC7C0A|nr:peptidylprolyl isomerase [Methylibium sp.]HEU4459731.1 peptidylprolyl isomerase [Methylibium sp.]